MASINTNISALNAQKSMIDQTNKSEQAIERLSTGLRINNAADDAAGTAIASKMESQVRSLGVAIRNGHDAISMTQTAEGALGEMENILQRVRELAVQAGNSTLSSQDRNAIQEEISQLTAEIDSIASSTNFNGIKLLDGSKSDVQFQVGVNSSDKLSVALEGSSAMDLGVGGSNGSDVYTSGRVTLAATTGVDEDAIKINGQNFLAANMAADTSGTTDAAKDIVTAINENTHVHGAIADAFNKVLGAEMGPDFKMTQSVTVGGVAITVQASMTDLAKEITQQVANVTATVGANNSLILENTTGDQIIVGAGGREVGFIEDTYEGMYTLKNVDGSAVKIELGTETNGYTAETTATAASANMFGLNQQLGAGITKSFAVSTDVLALTDDIRINGVQVGATISDSAFAKADAINAISDQTGVTATASTTAFLDLDFDVDPGANDVKINGNVIDVSGDTSTFDVASAINTANIGVTATTTEKGHLKLVTTGADIKIGLVTSIVGFVDAFTDGDDAVTSVADGATIRGTLTLKSEDGGTIRLTDNTVANSGLAKLGLEGQSETEASGSGGVNVRTIGGALSALDNIDEAISKLSGFRASFGAVENRIDAKINNLTTLKVNTQAAQSRIEDADFAAETTNMTKAQILSQAATSMLAQANASKQNLLALLQG